MNTQESQNTNPPQDPNYPQVFFSEAIKTYDETYISELTTAIITAIKQVYDPEIPVDIYELGLIYVIEYLDLTPNMIKVKIDMTLTAPGCPVAGSMPEWVANAVNAMPEIEDCLVDLVWEPFWTPERMSLRAKLELNMF
ncbi:SUF system Fe-S cluster assembly protein [Gammaproteobacteria bacterium]|nr:SUF system Fe-S cluster assembly protein [Gammaproteobacteria bacterium]